MTTVVDINVVTYYLLGTEPFVDEVRNFWRAVDEAWAPMHWEAEYTHAIWMAVRTGVLPSDEGHQNSVSGTLRHRIRPRRGVRLDGGHRSSRTRMLRNERTPL
jgi:hypothetical protein